MKIKIVNPNTTWAMTRAIEASGKAVARPGTEVVAVSPESGPASIESYYDEYLCIPGVLEEVRKGDAEGCDGYVIACFGDPGLHAARELTTKPVVGIAEAALYCAAMLAARFSIVTVIPRIHTMLQEMVRGYGMQHRVARIRTTPLYVLDVEKDPAHALEVLRAEAHRAKAEDDAEAILLGCAGFGEFADRLEAELEMPVFDGVAAAVKMVESLVELGKRTSKVKTYRAPEPKAFSGSLCRFGTG